jgi:hypothetical protein
MYFFIADAVVHHIWTTRHAGCRFNSYQEFLEEIVFTQRSWTDAPALKLINHISFSHNVNITIIGMKPTQHNTRFINAPCAKRNCRFLFFIFQNPTIKLLFDQQFPPVHLLYHNKKYFRIVKPLMVLPFLSDLPRLNRIQFNQCTIDQSLVQQIIKDSSLVKLPFSLVVFSTPRYVPSAHQNIINKHVIGFYQGPGSQVLALFLTPEPYNPGFKLSVIELDEKAVTFHKKNLLSRTRIQEGYVKSAAHPESNPELLNQDHCICNHPDTKRFFAPRPSAFKPLGKHHG